MGFRPYVGPLQEWMERLDEAAETDLTALRLLARYAGGVYVIRHHHVIAAHAGIRIISPHVAEIEARTDIEDLRNNGLARAVAARATKAVLVDGRVPIARITGNEPAERLAESLGYRLYGDSIEYYENVRS
jgi:predicted GNAT family acetyltransferase